MSKRKSFLSRAFEWFMDYLILIIAFGCFFMAFVILFSGYLAAGLCP